MASVQAELAIEDQAAEIKGAELPSYPESYAFKHDQPVVRYPEVKQETKDHQLENEARIDFSSDATQEIHVDEQQVFGVPKGTLELVDLEQKRLVHPQNIPLIIEAPSKAPVLQEFERSWRALRLCCPESAQEECDPGKT